MTLYEWNFASAVTIMIGYTALEYPFARLDGSWTDRAWYWDVIGHVLHIAPVVVVWWEWRISSIRIQWHRLPFYVFLLLVYLLINIGEGEKG